MLRAVLFALVFLISAAAPSHAGGRVALVVGVSKYEHAPGLPNTLNDAKDISAALKRLGFDVDMVLDPGRSELEAAVRRYGDGSAGAEASVFFYSGHALEAGGHNWVLPATANINGERDLRFEALDLDTILEQTNGAARVSIAFLDACRDNPFAGRISASGRSLSRGLGRIELSASGVLVAFSTAPGQVALDNLNARRNSPFTAALLSHLETAGLEVKSLLSRVTKDVVEQTKGKQRPWQNSSLEGDFYFVPAPPPPPAVASTAPQPGNSEIIFWDSIKASRNAAEFKAYLTRFPDGIFAELARNRIAMLQQATPEATGKPPTPSLHDDLVVRLTALSVATGEADSRARDYEAGGNHKAIAVSPKAHHTWRSTRWPTVEAAATAALESCQVYYSEPCTLAAADENIEAASALRDMPRTRYAGPFEPNQIPSAGADLLRRQDVVTYLSVPAPKAAAYHPTGRLFTSVGVASQFDSEQQALAQCNSDPARGGKDGPCFLYAVGDQVVLPQHAAKPLTSPQTNPMPQQQAALKPQNPSPTSPTPSAPTVPSSPTSGSSSPHDQLLARFAALTVAAASAQTQTRDYEAAGGHKAMAVAVAARLVWSTSGWANAEGASVAALEGCQVAYGAPCLLLAADDRIEPASSCPIATKDMPRPHYAGNFDPEQIPAADPGLLREAAVVSYRSVGGPKAAAYHPSGRLFVFAGSAGQLEAEEQALARCNSEPGRNGQGGPCFLYSAGNRVVLPQRLTKPRVPPKAVLEAFDYLNVPRWSYQYKDQQAHKAIAVVPESGQTFKWSGQSSTAIAEERVLEGCQLTFATPCVLLASDDSLRAPDPWKAARQDMPRLHKDGTYKPENVPLFLGSESELRSYVALAAPKAMVIRPNGARIRTATGKSPEEAQAKALAACNDDLDTSSFPCFVYAVNDRVVLGQRRTEPLK